MIDFVEMILMGVIATLVMDVLSIFLIKARVIHQKVKAEAVGRWTLYIFRGKFFHKDIEQTTPLKNEKQATLIFHYLIGIVLAGIYLVLELQIPSIRHQLWMPFVFGVATVLLPWLWLYPSIGLGFMASKTPDRSPYIITSLVNHTNFGLGLLIWVAFLRSFLM